MIHNNLFRPLAAATVCTGLSLLFGCRAALPTPEPLAIEGVRNVTRAGEIYLSGNATRAGLEAFKQRGVETVIDLRMPGQVEPDFVQITRDLDMTYIHLPMTSVAMTDGQARAFLSAMEAHADRPLLIHCRSANRSGAMFGVYAGATCGADADEAIDIGRRGGLKRDELAADVRRFLESRVKN